MILQTILAMMICVLAPLSLVYRQRLSPRFLTMEAKRFSMMKRLLHASSKLLVPTLSGLPVLYNTLMAHLLFCPSLGFCLSSYLCTDIVLSMESSFSSHSLCTLKWLMVVSSGTSSSRHKPKNHRKATALKALSLTSPSDRL